MSRLLVLSTAIASLAACTGAVGAPSNSSFGAEVSFLRKHKNVVVLSDRRSGARVAVIPAYQGRVMTSTAGGSAGTSYGWINHSLIASGQIQPHFNALGGEDRFWLGPEGGQYGLFFKKGSPFDLEHWYTPAPVDTEGFQVVSQGRDRIHFRRLMHLANYSNARFDVDVHREIRLLKSSEAWRDLRINPRRGVKVVAYETDNRIVNAGKRPWRKKTGLVSIWILGQFNPSPTTTITIPFQPGPVSERGRIVNDAYFGKVPSNRLVIKNRVLFFRADGKYRSKIGIPPQRAQPILGSYDAQNHVLTLVQYTLPQQTVGYVNSMWEIQKHPYGGDAANSYNDGPPKPGAKPLGPFYELETSSPAAALKPGQSMSHVHRTIHFQGSEPALDAISRSTLGVSLAEIKGAFAGK